MASTEKEKLINLLSERFFNPVLQARIDSYPPGQQGRLKNLQRGAQSAIEHLQNCPSADEVVTYFEHELNSDEAMNSYRDLRDFGLPTPHDAKADFNRLARDLGVKS